MSNSANTLRNQKYDQFSQELRIVGDVTDNVNLLVGAYYFDSEYQLFQTSRLGFVPATLSQTSGVKSRSYAAFSDVRFKLSDRLTIGGGGRYTRDRKSIFNNFGQVIPLVQLSVPTFTAAFGDCVGVVGLIAPGVPRFGPANNCTGKKSFGKFTWRAHADYEIGDNKLLYASYSKGFRSGGFNGRAGSPTSLGPYDPETVNAYEVGLKADWLDRRLRTNIALFRTDYRNKQEEVVQASPPGSANPQETVVRNAASARINGAEVEITAQPSDELTVFASLSYLDAEYKNFLRDVNGDLIPDDVSTLNLRRAPPVSWSVGFDYTREIGRGAFSLSPTLRFIDKLTTCIVANTPAVIGSVRNDDRCTTDAREILDVTTSYKLNIGSGEIKFSLFARNLLDDRGISSTLPVAGLFTFSGVRPPRQFGGEISFKF
jgi:iron complex outermembrane recepter protein